MPSRVSREPDALPLGQPADETAAGGSVLLEEGDGVDRDVGVVVDLVRVRVVPVVLVHPPGVADPHEEGGQHPADPVVRLAGAEDLPVRRLMAEEGELGEDDPQAGGDQQLQPRVLEQDQPGRGTAETDHQTTEQQSVEPGRAALEAGIPSLLSQRGVAVGDVLLGEPRGGGRVRQRKGLDH